MIRSEAELSVMSSEEILRLYRYSVSRIARSHPMNGKSHQDEVDEADQLGAHIISRMESAKNELSTEAIVDALG